jgi:NADP-dependent 3-hydroxy acid dehydrogenase YdfG
MALFTNKVAIVTGAASGIGLGISQEVSRQGGTVVLLDIDADRLKSASASMQGSHQCRTVDVTDFEILKKNFDEIRTQFGRIDFLFNNAGIGGTLPFEDATMEHWKKIIDLNLYGVIHGMTAVLPIMREQKSGYIVNTSSIAGLIPFQGQTLYNTTKFAMMGLSLTVEAELKKYNINITSICPGMVHTRIFYKPIIGQEAPEEYVRIPKEAISVEAAVSDIVKGLSKRKRVIVTPRFLNRIYRKYRIFGRI